MERTSSMGGGIIVVVNNIRSFRVAERTPCCHLGRWMRLWTWRRRKRCQAPPPPTHYYYYALLHNWRNALKILCTQFISAWWLILSSLPLAKVMSACAFRYGFREGVVIVTSLVWQSNLLSSSPLICSSVLSSWFGVINNKFLDHGFPFWSSL